MLMKASVYKDKIKYYGDSSPVITVDNFYDDAELNLIWRELAFLTSKRKMKPAKDTKAVSGLKESFGLFLDDIYANRNISDILNLNRKVFNVDFYTECINASPLFRPLQTCTRDGTLLSYYENEGVYGSHSDAASLTLLTYFFKEPKQFVGGNLKFTDFNIELQVKNNFLVIFPSCLNHEVTEVKMNNNSEELNGLGRYCMAQFISYNH